MCSRRIGLTSTEVGLQSLISVTISSFYYDGNSWLAIQTLGKCEMNESKQVWISEFSRSEADFCGFVGVLSSVRVEIAIDSLIRGLHLDHLGGFGLRCYFSCISPKDLQGGLVEAEPDVAVKDGQDGDLNEDYDLQDEVDERHPLEGIGEFDEEDEGDGHSQTHVEDDPNQESAEGGVVLGSDTVIQEHTVVVEPVHTSLAGVAVVAFARHICLAHVASD